MAFPIQVNLFFRVILSAHLSSAATDSRDQPDCSEAVKLVCVAFERMMTSDTFHSSTEDLLRRVLASLALLAVLLQALMPATHSRMMAAHADPAGEEIVICTAYGLQKIRLTADSSRQNQPNQPKNKSLLDCTACLAFHHSAALTTQTTPSNMVLRFPRATNDRSPRNNELTITSAAFPPPGRAPPV